jgi:hypothetical protein
VDEHIDRIMRRTNWKQRNGLVGISGPDQVIGRTISAAEMRAAVKAEAAMALEKSTA